MESGSDPGAGTGGAWRHSKQPPRPPGAADSGSGTGSGTGCPDPGGDFPAELVELGLLQPILNLAEEFAFLGVDVAEKKFSELLEEGKPFLVVRRFEPPQETLHRPVSGSERVQQLPGIDHRPHRRKENRLLKLEVFEEFGLGEVDHLADEFGDPLDGGLALNSLW